MIRDLKLVVRLALVLLLGAVLALAYLAWLSPSADAKMPKLSDPVPSEVLTPATFAKVGELAAPILAGGQNYDAPAPTGGVSEQ